jgi:hypothetical protein
MGNVQKRNFFTNVHSSQTSIHYLVYIDLSFKLYLSIYIREQVTVRIWHLFLIALLFILFIASIVQWNTLRLPLYYLQICLFMGGHTGKNSQYDVSSFLNYRYCIHLRSALCSETGARSHEWEQRGRRKNTFKRGSLHARMGGGEKSNDLERTN